MGREEGGGLGENDRLSWKSLGKTAMEGPWVSWEKHQPRPTFDLQPKGYESETPKGEDSCPVMRSHRPTREIGSGQSSRMERGPKLRFHS